MWWCHSGRPGDGNDDYDYGQGDGDDGGHDNGGDDENGHGGNFFFFFPTLFPDPSKINCWDLD